MPTRIVIEVPCRIRVSEITHGRLWRATILREGEPDLDAFGESSFAALLEALDQEELC